MASVPPATPEDWGDRYRLVRSSFEHYAEKLRDLLATLLDGNGIETADVQQRAKTVDSFVDKIHRKGQKYADPLNDITDLCGIRVIAYYLEDLELIGELIDSEFEVDWSNSVNPAQSLDPDRFGYAAPSFVVTLQEPRRSLGEWAPYTDLRAEIQVRTIAQHAWAALDHKLRYKRGEEAPRELHRDLSRLSALFELADKEFSDIRRRAQELSARYEEKVEQGDFELGLNQDSLTIYFQITDWNDRLAALALAAGWQPMREETEEEALAARSDRNSRLLIIAGRIGIRDLAQLDAFLIDSERWAVDALRTIAEASQEEGFQPWAVPEDVASILMLCAGRVVEPLLGWKDALQKGITAAITAMPEEL